jgi:NhaP-type Na+/H+ or K+/H+ antiporter
MLLALLPFAVYLVANQFSSSGILAAVSAGVTPKNSKKRNQYLASG